MSHVDSRITRAIVLCLAIVGAPSAVLAWGPHSEITAAAIHALGRDDALLRRLGRNVEKLPEYAWMADWRRTVRKESDQWFYVDDYLLFPGMPGHVELRGTITSPPAAGIEKVPAKVVLLGTTYSTLADPDGRYEFRQVPSGTYTTAVFGPGSAIATAEITLTAGSSTTRDVTLSAGPGGAGLMRNGAMALRWASPARPDTWLTGPKGTWSGEFLPLEPGRNYRLVIDWREGALGQVAVRWTASMAYGAKFLESKPLEPGDEELSFTGSDSATFAQVFLRGKGSPADLCRSIAVVPGP